MAASFSGFGPFVRRYARRFLVVISAAMLTAGLSIANLQAGRFPTASGSLAFAVVASAVVGLGLSFVKSRRLRRTLALAVLVATVGFSVLSQAPPAGAQGECAVTARVGDSAVTSNPADGTLGSRDDPVRLSLAEDALEVTVDSGRRFDWVVVRAKGVEPVETAEINLDGDALDLTGTTATASVRVVESGGALRLGVDDRSFAAPIGVVNIFGSFYDDGAESDECSFSVFVQFVAPAARTRFGQLGLTMAGLGLIGLLGTALVDPGGSQAKADRSTVREPVLVRKRPSDTTGFHPDDDYAVIAAGAPDDPAEDRSVFAQVEVNREARQGFTSYASNDLYVWLAHSARSEEAVSADPVVEVDTDLWIDVVLHAGEIVEQRELFIPRRRGVESSMGHFRIDLDLEGIDATLIFWNRINGRAWEVVALQGPATELGDVAFKMHSIERDRGASSVHDRGVDYAAPRSVGLVAVEGDLLRFDPTTARSFLSSGTETWGVDLGHEVHALQLAHAGAIANWADPLVTEALIRIAQQGAAMRKHLVGADAVHSLTGVEHIQLINADQIHHLPIEFLYEHQPPSSNAIVRSECLAALRSAAGAPCGCPPQGHADVVCPFGFWGISRIIERYEVRRLGVNRLPHARPDRHLPRPDRTVFGVSDRVSNEAVIALRDSLMGAGAGIGVRQAQDWHSWESLLADDDELLLALPHQASMALELGGSRIGYGDDLGPLIGSTERLVVLLGCNTVESLPNELRSFGVRFLESGASVVIGSCATLHVNYTPQVAALMVAELRRSAVNGHRFGEAMRRARCQLLGNGYPIALALVAIGDAGWTFAGTATEHAAVVTF